METLGEPCFQLTEACLFLALLSDDGISPSECRSNSSGLHVPKVFLGFVSAPDVAA